MRNAVAPISAAAFSCSGAAPQAACFRCGGAACRLQAPAAQQRGGRLGGKLTNYFRLGRGVAALAVMLAVMGAGFSRAGSSKKEDVSPSKKTPEKKSTLKSSSKKNLKASASKKRRYRREGSKTRLARLKLDPARASEIQQALIARGYLNQQPNGVWDDSTRSAMRRFQEEHQFPTTGLPEAKSLMKLGLGPHPLPDELDPAALARAQASPPEGPGSNPSIVSPTPQQ